MMMTRLNPDGRTYRIPLVNGANCQLDSGPTIPCFTGSIANRLGAYESLGLEPEELEALIKRAKKQNLI